MDDARDLILSEIEESSGAELDSYLLGAAHDATRSRAHGTIRFCQADRRWLEVVGAVLSRLGKASWIYREGASRSCWVLESTWRHVPGKQRERAAYARGYFDAEGGVPRDPASRFYIQLTQKDRDDLTGLRSDLDELGVACGRLHNPSVVADPDYWRFYVSCRSHADFCTIVSSWHPRKRPLLDSRLVRH